MMQPRAIDFTVYVEDTDVTGFVYHSRYLNFCERARSHLLTVDDATALRDLHASGYFFVVREVSATYIKPLRLNDHFTIQTQVVDKGHASIHLNQDIYRFDVCIFKARITLVLINKKGRPSRISPSLWGRLQGSA